jgi:ethanolamine ammonia-lyase large subunit
VKLAEQVAELTQARLVILLIGERPGGDALAARSLSAYLAYHLLDADAQSAAAQASGNPAIRFEYSVISNIYSGGLPAVEAGSVIAELAWRILDCRAAGNRLEGMRPVGVT